MPPHIHDGPVYQDGGNGSKTPEGDDARPDVEDGAPRLRRFAKPSYVSNMRS